MNILRPLSPHLRGRVFSILIFFGVLGFSSVFLQLLGINLDMLLGPLFHRILVHLVVSRFGWYSGGFLLAMVFVGLDLENQMMMAPSGENCDKEVTSSSSWNWRKCLNLSSDTEENQTPGPQAPPLPIESGTVPPANAVAFSEAGPSQVAPPAPANRPPEEQTSSTWSGSWIGRWFNQEVCSSAVNEVGHEATSQPEEVLNTPEAPPVPQPVPQPVVIPQLAQPLISDEMRSSLLYKRFLLLNFGGNDDLRRMISIIDSQSLVERYIEAALVADGVNPHSILSNFTDIRGLIHSPHGRLLSARTYDSYVTQILERGTRESVPYRRISQAIQNYQLFL